MIWIIVLFLVVKLDKCNVKGYIVWFLMDNLEWRVGYLECFGFYYVDFNDKNRIRILKVLVKFYKYLIIENGFKLGYFSIGGWGMVLVLE